VRSELVVAVGVILMLGPGGSWAAVEGPGVDQRIQAVRADGPIQVDGKLDEEAWAKAVVFDGFVERFPTPGKEPSERTELRVLYDDRNVYFGVVCRDSQPERISRQLGRRDSNPASDAVQVIIDPSHNHRTAYLFYLNAGGVQGDGLLYDDRFYTTDWDGVWDGAAGSVPDGWVAEYAIPLHQLQFPEAEVQTWGFGVRRNILRTHEEIDSVNNPRSSNATPSRLGHLTGMTGLRSQRAVELTPYVAARARLRPQFSDLPDPRLWNPSADVGLDLRAQLTSDLRLVATVNPDFGQVEADQLLLNLSTFEAFFPEKRPFFTQGLELFQPVGGPAGQSPHALFYSRRIGLEAPILAAAKVTGSVGQDLEVGVLDALVLGPAGDPSFTEANPDRRFQLHLEQPLHFGLNDELSARPPPPTNYFTGVARARLGKGSRVGAMVATATPMAIPCGLDDPGEQDRDDATRPVSCDALGGNAGAVDLDLKTDDSQYGVQGQLSFSQAVAGPLYRVMRDGTVIHRGDLGGGGYVRAGRFGGDGLRFDASYEYSSPTLNLNPTGFQRTQNEQHLWAGVRYHRPDGWGPFKAFWGNLNSGTKWTTDGRFLNRVNWVNLNVQANLPSFDFVGFETGLDYGGFNVREISGTGVPLQQSAAWFLAVFTETNRERLFSADGFAAVGYHFPQGPSPGRWGWGGNMGFNLRAHSSLETRLEVGTDRTPFGPRYYDLLGAEDEHRYLFGDLESNFLSLTLRQSWIISPRLTLQAYAQLFTAYGVWGPYYEGRSDAQRSPILLDSLAPTTFSGSDPSFYDTALNVNVVLRWEYRLGSTFFLVYTRSQAGEPIPDGQVAPRTVLPVRLLSGPAHDAVLVKWSYYWTP
jgi:hypothetical protein